MKVLVLGDGLLGKEIVKQTGWSLASRSLGSVNISDSKSLLKLIMDYEVVVNCIANTSSYSKNKDSHWEVNYLFASKLSDLCLISNTKLVHISTEFVYANNNFPTEEDIPLPDNNWYAYTKLLADEYIKLKNNNYLICRELHKPNPFPYNEVWDVYTSGDTVDKISNLIIKLIQKNAKGVFNVGTGKKKLLELAPNSKLIKPPKGVPTDTSMNLEKLNKFINE